MEMCGDIATMVMFAMIENRGRVKNADACRRRKGMMPAWVILMALNLRVVGMVLKNRLSYSKRKKSEYFNE
jgi:hypothetical protein